MFDKKAYNKEYLKTYKAEYNQRPEVKKRSTELSRKRRLPKLIEKYWGDNPPKIEDCLQHPILTLYYWHKDWEMIISSRPQRIDYGIPILPIATSVSHNGYVKTHFNGKSLRVHRFKWECYNGVIPEGMLVDHIDRNRLNNDMSNLRLVDISSNNHNKKKRANCSSQYHGVHISRGKWIARTSVNNKTKMIGSYEDEIEAAHAYDNYCVSIGRLALNFPKTRKEEQSESWTLR